MIHFDGRATSEDAARPSRHAAPVAPSAQPERR